MASALGEFMEAAVVLTAAQSRGIGLENMLIALGAVLVTIWALGGVRKRLRERAETESLTPRERLEKIKARAQSKDRVEEVMADAEELTRRLAAHLDNKAARLEQLLDEANRRIAELESALERPNGRRHDAGDRTSDAYRGRGQTRAPRLEMEEPHHFVATMRDPLTESVYRLADEGLPPVQIAQKLDEQVGKVELILALRGG